MGYRGQTYAIQCNRGGLNASRNVDLIPPYSFVAPTRNIMLHEGGWRKRGGTAKVNSSALSGAPSGRAGIDFQLTNGSFQVVFTSDGKLYSNVQTGTTIKTGLSTVNYGSFAIFGGELFFCDGEHTPQTWDGAAASTSDITTPAADWSGSSQPIQCLAHGRGASRRMWFLMGNSVYYGALGNGKVASGAGTGKITIDVQLGQNLRGMIEWQNRLFVYSKNQFYIIDDTDTDPANWGYEPAAWFGGAMHWRVVVKTPNDLIVMSPDGEVYSVAAVFQYGDYKKASLGKPAFIDNYIRENIKLGSGAMFHGVYDPVIRAVLFWVVRQGFTNPDTCFAYFIDRPPEEAWVMLDNQDYASGYTASCSFLVETSTGIFVVYTTDFSGFVWKLNQVNRNDDNNGYYAGVRLVNLPFDNPRISKHFKRGRVVLESQGAANLNVGVWVDSQVKTSTVVPMTTTGATLGSFILGTDTLGGVEFLDQPFNLGYYGKRLQLELYNSRANEDFFISQIFIDFKPLGAQP